MIFLKDVKNSKIVTYDDLLDQVNNFNKFEYILKEDNVFHFFFKLIYNLCHNIDTVILDNDVPADLKEIKLNNSVIHNKTDKLNFKTWNNLLKKLLNTTSKISLYTSGTTGEPKKVVHNARKFINMARIGEKYSDNVWAFLYNPTHMAGLQVFFQGLLNKNTIVYLFQSTRSEFINSCKNHYVSNVSATPTFYKLLSPYNFKLVLVKKCTLGGEKSSPKLTSSLNNIFPNASIFNIYASTEAGSLFVSKGEIFKVINNLKDKVMFIENELVVHNSLLGEFEKKEWFHTGDIVEFVNEEKTEFKIISRKSDTINIGGNRINLLEVEQEINKLKGVLNTLVYSIDNSILGKIIVAEIITSIEYSKKEFKRLLKDKLPSYKIPTKIKFVEELEVTRTGKIKRNLN
jgi:acyl-coenzyme A synthetase/AMP-(fatty) acid ligase